MATNTTTLARNVHVKQGLNTFGGAAGYAVAAGILSAVIDTAGNPAGSTLSLTVSYSSDGGATWQPWAAMDFSTDPGTDKQGNPTTLHSLSGDWPGPALRLVITASAAVTLNLSATLTV
jgi:hypothetical protein